jgi:hypothetical protein
VGLVALVVIGAFAAGTAGAVDVGVTLASGGGDRTLFVRDALDQNDLTSIDFGDSHSQAFTVRVEDNAFDHAPFTVSAEMTNLYVFQGGQWIYDADTAPFLPSSELTISSIDGVDGSVVSAALQPVVDLTANITGLLCTTLGLGASPCTINLNDVVAKNLSVVPAGLPIVPQAPEAGNFAEPAYTADAPDKPGDQTTWDDGTPRRLLGGDLNIDTTFLDGLVTQAQSAIDGVLTTGSINELDDIVDLTVLQSALDTQTSLTGTLITTLLGNLSVVWDATVGSVDVVSQTASYHSNPVLNVTVPESATAPTYKGTLVITGVG